MIENFQALVVDKQGDDFSIAIQSLSQSDLPDGEVLVRTAYSSVNYKDGLASIPDGNIVRTYPFVPGIDLAGTVVSSTDDRFQAGDKVIATSYEIGVSHFGGFSEYARLKSEWIVPLPEGLTLKEAMAYGTAGFTAALSIQRLEENGLRTHDGDVLVTGATGGVGSLAVAMLAKLGYNVVASTGKASESDYLKNLGAGKVVSREDVTPEKIRPLGEQRWAAAIDPVGGKTLAAVVSNTTYGGSVAVSGMLGGTNVPTNIFPFILRGVNVLGIDSVYYPLEKRIALWERMATELKPANLLSDIGQEVRLEQLRETLTRILNSEIRGRTIVAY